MCARNLSELWSSCWPSKCSTHSAISAASKAKLSTSLCLLLNTCRMLSAALLVSTLYDHSEVSAAPPCSPRDPALKVNSGGGGLVATHPQGLDSRQPLSPRSQLPCVDTVLPRAAAYPSCPPKGRAHRVPLQEWHTNRNSSTQWAEPRAGPSAQITMFPRTGGNCPGQPRFTGCLLSNSCWFG